MKAEKLKVWKANRKKWVRALRSGKYKQTDGQLFDGTGYCCLGVLCKIMGMKPVKRSPRANDYEMKPYPTVLLPHYYFGRTFTITPKKVMDMVGLIEGTGEYHNDISSSLANDNDAGKGFDEIADIIEKEPEGLFKA